MAPVGSYESLSAALQGGADSVYFGVEGLNMRARSSANFTLDDLRNIVGICEEKGVKTYLTVNTIIYNNELQKMHEVIDCAKEAGVLHLIWLLFCMHIPGELRYISVRSVILRITRRYVFMPNTRM